MCTLAMWMITMCTDYDLFFFFFFNDTATTEIYTLSLHDALPIYVDMREEVFLHEMMKTPRMCGRKSEIFIEIKSYDAREIKRDRKSTRLNSSHGYISYAVFCLKKKNKHTLIQYDECAS